MSRSVNNSDDDGDDDCGYHLFSICTPYPNLNTVTKVPKEVQVGIYNPTLPTATLFLALKNSVRLDFMSFLERFFKIYHALGL